MENNIDFKWPMDVPSGHRSIVTESGNIRKNIKTATLIMEDGTIIDLFKGEIDDLDRLVLICAAMGVYGGIRNEISSGYVCAATINAPAHLKPPEGGNGAALSIETGKYAKARIEVSYDKIVRTALVEFLMNACYTLAFIVEESEGSPIKIDTKSDEPKKAVSVTDEDLDVLMVKKPTAKALSKAFGK